MWAQDVYTGVTFFPAQDRGNERKIVKELGKKFGALAAVLAFVFVGAVSCPGDETTKVTGTVNSVYRPPVAENHGCTKGTWSVSIDPDSAQGKPLAERDKARVYLCLHQNEASKLKSGDRYSQG